MITADAPAFEFFPPVGQEDDRNLMIRQGTDFATRSFVPADQEARIDPLQRLFDPDFTETTWWHEYSKVGDLPGSLHAKQLEAFIRDSRHIWLFWGNQVGKTTLGAAFCAMAALGRHPLQKAIDEKTGKPKMRMPPVTIWASALTWELWEKVLLPELLSWIPHWRIVDAPRPFAQSNKRDIVILADNGQQSRITGKAAEQGAERYQSARVDIVWLDEEHPEAVWDEMQPRLLRYGGRTIATMTPLKGMTWVHGRVYEPIKTGMIPPERHWHSHAGLRDNPSITPEARAEMLEELKHNPAQLAARDEGLFVRPFGAVLPWDAEKHLTQESLTVESNEMIIARVRYAWYGALDLGKWRFAFTFGYADRDGNFLIVDEYFSQRDDATERAKGIHDLLKSWRVPDTISIPADCADPKGIKELNAAFEAMESPYRVYAIPGELKAKTTGIARVESMINRGALKVRRGIGAAATWFLGRNSNNFGKPVNGSRWIWEISNWQYPKTPDGKVQKDEPDDASADGADMMDATRYLVVSFFPADPLPKPKKNPTVGERIQKELEDLDKQDPDLNPKDSDRFGGTLRQ